MSDATTPIELRAPQNARILEVDWADGTSSQYRHEDLRAFCPCAECQGHQGPVRRTKATFSDPELVISDLEEVGNYGLRLTWEDGHATGIYAFAFLRRLAPLYGANEDERNQAKFER